MCVRLCVHVCVCVCVCACCLFLCVHIYAFANNSCPSMQNIFNVMTECTLLMKWDHEGHPRSNVTKAMIAIRKHAKEKWKINLKGKTENVFKIVVTVEMEVASAVFRRCFCETTSSVSLITWPHFRINIGLSQINSGDLAIMIQIIFRLPNQHRVDF